MGKMPKKIKMEQLKEMDIVLRRDGKICWIMKNENTQRMQTFALGLYGQHELLDYEDFVYGKNVKHFNPERDKKYDIVSVCQTRSPWHAIHLVRNYELALKSEDDEAIKQALADFSWVEVGPHIKNDVYNVYIVNACDGGHKTYPFEKQEVALAYARDKYRELATQYIGQKENALIEAKFSESTGSGKIHFLNTETNTETVIMFCVKEEKEEK